jgi:hypothetical protein
MVQLKIKIETELAAQPNLIKKLLEHEINQSERKFPQKISLVL